MARFSAGGRATIAGTNLLPLASLYATAASRPGIVEVSVANTTAVAVAVALQRLTTAGTQGAAVSVPPSEDIPEGPVAVATPKNGHTVGPTITAGVLRQISIGAAIGSGWIWTWPDNHPLAIPVGTANGVGITIPTGTGQILDWSITWIE